jgi:hypothetical protein
MVTPRQLAANDEKLIIQQWIESVADIVGLCPSRVATAANMAIHYDQSTVSRLPRDFNAASKSKKIPSQIEKVVACKHIFHLRSAKEGAADEAGAQAMMASMQKLYGVCKLNRIGVSVHMPEPGLVEIDLIPQTRPQPVYKIKPPKIAFGR